MTIQDVRADWFNIPLPTVLTDSMHGEMRHFAVVTARIRTSDGAEGLGYTYTVGKTGGGAVLQMIRDDLVPLLLGQDPRRIEQLWQTMWWALHYVGRGGIASFAMAAVDIALWDLKAMLSSEPLWRYLGGHRNQVPAYAGGIDLYLADDELVAQTQANLDLGFRAIKMKIGRERLADDVARVRLLRETLGPDIPLMADANFKWTADQAIRAARALAPYDLYWLEEPTIPEDFEGHARVLHEGGLPVASGENLHTVYEFQKLIASGGVSFPEPDITNLGGITPWLKVAHLAECHNLPVTSHGVHDLHVHLLAAVPNGSYLEAHGFGLERFVEHPLAIVEGLATAADRPGHGVVFDWDALEAHRGG